MQCRAHVAQLGRLYPEFQSKGVEVLVILGDTITRAISYAEVLHLPFPILADRDRYVYHQYGLGRALGFVQRTASILVDRNGIIRYLRSAINPYTWLEESRELLQEVHGLKEPKELARS